MGGNVDAIVFTGGIGEGDVAMRQAILEGLEEHFHISIDPSRNENAISADIIMDIHPPFARIKVLVVPTDEEISIAMQSSELALPPAPAEPSISATVKTLSQVKTNLFCHSLGQTYTAPQEVGLLAVFAASVERVGYFRPVARKGTDAADYRIELMKKHFSLSDSSESMYGVAEEEAWLSLTEGHEEEMFERILEKYLAYAADKDFVMVSSFTDGDDSLHWAGKLCSALNIPAILFGDSKHDTQFGIARSAFEGHGAQCLGAIMSDVENVERERKMLEESGLQPLALIPKSETLSRRTVREVMTAVEHGVCLYGKEHLDEFFKAHAFSVIEQDAGLHVPNDWPAEMEIPAYVFHGVKGSEQIAR